MRLISNRTLANAILLSGFSLAIFFLAAGIITSVRLGFPEALSTLGGIEKAGLLALCFSIALVVAYCSLRVLGWWVFPHLRPDPASLKLKAEFMELLESTAPVAKPVADFDPETIRRFEGRLPRLDQVSKNLESGNLALRTNAELTLRNAKAELAESAHR